MHPHLYGQMANHLHWQTEQLRRMEQRVQHLERTVKQLNETVSNLEQTVRQSQADIDSLKQRSHTTIERIEYKFDQLKIETLEGTLNIGIAPEGGKSIEEFEVNGQSLDQLTGPQQTDLFDGVQQQVVRYLHEEVPRQLALAQQQHALALEANYADTVIEDIRKQIDGRIRYYISGSDYEAEGGNPDEEMSMIAEKVKRDIDEGLSRHIQSLLDRKG
ncbi:spore germination protein GerPC [Paenibacillus sp. MSJ-34]|uniref:spore germination protein GerPC n=1 Tax=Paenibacillus sp. MSJ-34 TaxID=2841529 RepID=UPI001C11A245|nr:spore germination protein GerPC [Paenibacillus sp. MSJ-34]MBU5443526.1 spore germination protein GerPC [Paenibacillus sp. MSJ-34]